MNLGVLIKSAQITLPEQLIQQAADANNAPGSGVTNLKIKLNNGSVSVSGTVHHLVDINFDTTWSLHAAGRGVTAMLLDASASFLHGPLVRKMIFEQFVHVALAHTSQGRVTVCMDTIWFDVAKIAEDRAPGFTLSLQSVDAVEGAIVAVFGGEYRHA